MNTPPNEPTFFQIFSNAFGRGVFPHQMSWFLDLPGRGLIMSARTVASRLPVNPDAHVMEVGPGSGYYSAAVARRVPAGTLALVDIQPEMLEKASRRLRAAGITNFTTHVPTSEVLPFGDATFDAMFMVTVFGEIEGRDAFLAEARRVLKPGGVLSITEHHPDPDFEPKAAVAAHVERFGFVVQSTVGWRWAYTLNAVRPEER